MSKRIALKGMLDKLGSAESISITNRSDDKSLRFSFGNSKSVMNIPADMVPDEIIRQKKGRFHFSISGEISGNVKDKSVPIKVTDYSVSLYDDKPDKPRP